MSVYHVGVDLGGTNLRCAVVDKSWAIIARHECATRADEGCDAIIKRMADGVNIAVAAAKLRNEDINAIGIGAPGPLDGKRGVVIEAPNLPGWINVPLALRLQELTGIQAFLENDANAAGFGEFRAGAGKGSDSMVMMTLGTGVGGAVILGGKLWTGPDGTAGEIGHVCIVANGRTCGCGRKGCIEAYASANSTVARFREARVEGKATMLSGEHVTCADIFSAAGKGDPLAKDIISETGRLLGLMAANMANLLNPERCVFAGGMTRAWNLLSPPLLAEVDRHALATPKARMQVLPAALGDDAGLIGAAGCAMVACGHA